VRVYLDLCCLKRPFDHQEQPVIRLQTEAVLSILALPSGTIELLRSPALLLENSLNLNQARREAVALWLSEDTVVTPNETDLILRLDELTAKGFRNFDAFHLASAELMGADTFLTVDLQILRLASRVAGELHVQVTDPVHFVEEISQWKH
jgi:hypothetical protein